MHDCCFAGKKWTWININIRRFARQSHQTVALCAYGNGTTTVSEKCHLNRADTHSLTRSLTHHCSRSSPVQDMCVFCSSQKVYLIYYHLSRQTTTAWSGSSGNAFEAMTINISLTCYYCNLDTCPISHISSIGHEK